ncbi:hypothetical protein LXA43DRAFT_1091086 [Ganoderma leucocontextum]|nr:hypothetical protein LXA43DRAFT_1091086 [Ganoderma leucocontextum]
MTKASSSSSSSSSKTDRSYPDLGMPSREEFAAMEEHIWMALHNPRDNTIGSPQFRWWVRKMFVLARADEFGVLVPFAVDTDNDEAERGEVSFVEYRHGEDGNVQEAMVMTGAPYLSAALPLPVVLHDGKRVAIREQIYDILCVYHERVRHGGRDKTATEIRKNYTWVPKDLIALFVKNCPTCVCKRTRRVDDRRADTGLLPEALPMATSRSPMPEEASQATLGAQYAPLPMNTLIGDPQPTLDVSHFGLPQWSPSAQLERSPLVPAPNTIADNGLPSMEGPSSWYFPPGSAIPSGPGYYFLPNGMYGAPLLRPHAQLDSVQLPSIRVTEAEGHARPHAKVTLPSLSQVLSGELTAAGRGHCNSHIRQPLQALPGNRNGNGNGNVDPGFDPLQFNSSPLRGGHLAGHPQVAPYVPAIDPALLAQDGVQMLAMAAEVVQRGG